MSVFGLFGYKNDERLCKKKLCRQEYLHEIERFWFNDAIIMFHRLLGGEMLKNLIDPNETILWQGKPHHFLYTLGNPLIYPFALCWGIFDLFFMTKFNAASHGIFPFMNFFMLLHLAPVWYALFSPVYRFFNWYRIDYALTDKRLYFTAGLVGLDITSAELPEVQNLRVYVGVMETLFKRGTIRFGNTNALRSVEKPYEVYKQIQQTAMDITTDRQFPNQLRPQENPGYQTRYKP